MANQFRNYVLTINNPVQTDDEFFDYLKSLKHIKYFAFQREQGKEKSTPHFQLYIEFNVGKTFNTMKTNFPTAHIEQRKGSKQQARDYCLKDDGTRLGNPYEWGTFAEERERTDLTDIIELIHSGASDLEVQTLFPSQYFRYYKNIQYLRQLFLEEKYKTVFRNLEVIYIHGSAGIGKTRFVMEKHGYENVFRITSYERGMFDAYKGQPVICFEEFRSSLKIEEMLNYLDGYPLQLPCRYNDKTACFTTVYIVTNIAFNEQYKNIQADQPATWGAFTRRIHKVIDFDKNKTITPQQMQMQLIEADPDELPF